MRELNPAKVRRAKNPMKFGGGDDDDSSGEEDGDAQWKAAIDSVATVVVSSSNCSNKPRASARSCASSWSRQANFDNEKEDDKAKSPLPKLYQIKAQKLLDYLLDKKLELVETHIPVNNDHHQSDGGVIKLFKKAPPGMKLDPVGNCRRLHGITPFSL
ncbi:hypothetical protein AXF42_Ash012894 [Apostasia shenzhenica]|uniref:Uncharacterized protein n=1 Tax=Apostasia shenzhenica TaxID=1088818 RepID=A0A2I0ARJ0_9ASPA|nr:hypothetical protein AXF42_Ash012894 [Apostasia shenzhenica]